MPGIKRGMKMFTQIEVKKGLINVAQLQGKVDELIFDYIDTSKNYGKAFKGLNNLFQQTVKFYVSYINEHKGSIPEGNVYWTLFADVTARLIYFKCISEKQLTNLQTDEDVENTLEGYLVAANCLPNTGSITERFLLDEISESYEEIILLDGVKGRFKQSIIEKNNSIRNNLTHLYQYAVNFTE